MEILYTTSVILLITMVLYYMYETNVVWEYLNKFSDLIKINFSRKILNGFLLVKAFEKSGESNYLLFLNRTYNTFITRLLSCPICLNFWICLLFSFFTKIYLFPIYAFFSLSLYFIIKFLTKVSSKI